MITIEAKNLSINFPIYANNLRSFKKKIIKVLSAGKIFSQDEKIFIEALKKINFVINDGDKVGLIGGNGSGKTTLLRTIMGIYYPTGGEIICREKVTSLIDIELGIDEDATGFENIILRGLMLGLNRDEIENKISEIEKFSELGDYLDFPVRIYSSGMKIRLAFSIIISINPKIIIMDEWLSVGDQDFRNKATLKINEIIDKSSTLVIASHDFEQLKKTCNRIFKLEQGSISEINPKFL